MANSNYSTANRLLAYISHGVDLTPEIKNNYANSLIFIGDEGQIYSPINNTYVGIGQTSYTNLLAYTNYISAQLDALRTMMNSALVSKVYANYDNYDLYTAEHLTGENNSSATLATYALVEDYKVQYPDWGADYATKELTLRGLGDYDPVTKLAYTTITVGEQTLAATKWAPEDLEKASNANNYAEGVERPTFEYQSGKTEKSTGELPQLVKVGDSADTTKYYLAAYVNVTDGVASLKTGVEGNLDQYEVNTDTAIQPGVKVQNIQNVWETNNAFGSSGITVTLSHGEAKPVSDSFGHVYNTYSRNVFTIDDSLTWSYIASAYTYSMDFARQWATSEANRIYNNLLGSEQESYPVISYDDVARLVQQQGFHADLVGYVNATEDADHNWTYTWYDPSSYNHDSYYVFEDYQYVVKDLLFYLYVSPTTYELSQVTGVDAVDDTLHFDSHGLPYIVAKWSDVFDSSVNPQRKWAELYTKGNASISAKLGEDVLNATVGNAKLIDIISKDNVIYAFEQKNSEYNSTYNVNIADGIQTLKEVAYLLDVLTDGFGSVTYYTAIPSANGALYTKLQGLSTSIANASISNGTDTDIATADNAYNNPAGIVHIENSEEHIVFAQSEITEVYAYYWVDGEAIFAAAPGTHLAAQYTAYYGDPTYIAAMFARVNTHTDVTDRGTTLTHKDIYVKDEAIASLVENSTYVDYSGKTDYYTAYEGSYTRVKTLDHNYLNDLANSGYLYTIIKENVNYQKLEYFKVYAEIVEEMSTDNIGIKMAYTIAGNQEQINILSNRLTDVELGKNVLRSIDTTSNTYVSLTTVSNQEGLKVGEYTYNVGDTNIKVGLHFGSTYTTQNLKDVVFVNTAYMNIGFIGEYDGEGKKLLSYNDTTKYICYLEAVTDVTKVDASYLYYTNAAVGYRYLTADEAKDAITNGSAPVYTAREVTGGDVVIAHNETLAAQFHVDFVDWADDSTSYYKLTDRVASEDATKADKYDLRGPIHTDAESHGLTYTSWVNSYVADTYTLVTNAMTTMEADIINASKSMLDSLDYSYAASSSQFISYTYQWNGMIGAAARELPSDEIYSNVEVWGDNSSLKHRHIYELVDSNDDIMYDGTYTYQYVYTYYDNTSIYEQAYIDGPWANGGNTETNRIVAYYQGVGLNETDAKAKKLTYVTNPQSGNATKQDHGTGAYWSEYRTAVREAFYLNADLQVYRKATEADGLAYELVKLDLKNYGDNWADVLIAQGVELYVEPTGAPNVGEYVLIGSKDGGRTVQESVTINNDGTVTHSPLNNVLSPSKSTHNFNGVTGVNVALKGSLDYITEYDEFGVQRDGWTESQAAEQHPRTTNTISYTTAAGEAAWGLGAKNTFNNWPFLSGENPDNDPTWVNSFTSYVDAGFASQEEFDNWAHNGYVYIANDAAEEFVQYYYKVPRYVEVDPQDLMIGETTYQYGYDKDTDHSDDNETTGITYTGTYYYVDHIGTGTDIKWGIISDVVKVAANTATKDGDHYSITGKDGEWYVVDETETNPTVFYKKEYVQLYKKCEADEAVEQIKYIDTAFKHITAADGGYGENRMHVTTYITHLEDATASNSGLVDAYDARTFIDNMFEWVDLSATVSSSSIDAAINADGNTLKTSIYTTEHYNALNPNETTYTFANRIYVKEIK